MAKKQDTLTPQQFAQKSKHSSIWRLVILSAFVLAGLASAIGFPLLATFGFIPMLAAAPLAFFVSWGIAKGFAALFKKSFAKGYSDTREYHERSHPELEGYFDLLKAELEAAIATEKTAIQKEIDPDSNADLLSEFEKSIPDVTKLTEELTKKLTEKLTEELTGKQVSKLTKELTKKLTEELTKKLTKKQTKELAKELAKEQAEKQAEKLAKELAKKLGKERTDEINDWIKGQAKVLFKEPSKDQIKQMCSNKTQIKARANKLTIAQANQLINNQVNKLIRELTNGLTGLTQEQTIKLTKGLTDKMTPKLTEDPTKKLTKKLAKKDAKKLAIELTDELTNKLINKSTGKLTDELTNGLANGLTNGLTESLKNVNDKLKNLKEAPNTVTAIADASLELAASCDRMMTSAKSAAHYIKKDISKLNSKRTFLTNFKKLIFPFTAKQTTIAVSEAEKSLEKNTPVSAAEKSLESLMVDLTKMQKCAHVMATKNAQAAKVEKEVAAKAAQDLAAKAEKELEAAQEKAAKAEKEEAAKTAKEELTAAQTMQMLRTTLAAKAKEEAAKATELYNRTAAFFGRFAARQLAEKVAADAEKVAADAEETAATKEITATERNPYPIPLSEALKKYNELSSESRKYLKSSIASSNVHKTFARIEHYDNTVYALFVAVLAKDAFAIGKLFTSLWDNEPENANKAVKAATDAAIDKSKYKTLAYLNGEEPATRFSNTASYDKPAVVNTASNTPTASDTPEVTQ